MNSESNKEYSVNWKNHMSHVRKAFDHLLSSSELTDVTLCCEGKKIGAHKMLLSACSTYFRDTFKDVPCQHPVIILYGIEYSVLSDILQFIYRGEVSVDTSKLDLFLKTAQLLQISGLTDDPDDKLSNQNEQNVQAPIAEQRIEETYVEPITYSATACEDVKKGVKRTRSNETEVVKDKVQKQEDETLFVSDVKCEPSEIGNFEDPLEDPLLQSEQSNDTREFFGTATTQEEDEFKIETDESDKPERFGDVVPPVEKLVPKNTLKTKSFIWSTFKKFCHQRRYVLSDSTSTERLSEILADWGCNMRKADGSDYKESVVKMMWNMTAKMLQEMYYSEHKRVFNPFRDIQFKKARDSRDMKRRQLRSCPDKRKVTSVVLNADDRYKIYSVYDENTPSGLQKKFFYIAAFELAWNTQTAVACMVHYFKEEFDSAGNFTGRIEYNPTFGSMGERSHSTCESKWLVPDTVNPEICPIRLFQRLIEKRQTLNNATTERFFLTPNPNWNKSEDNAWFKDCPVGRNQIASWIKAGAEKLGIDTKKYKIKNYGKDSVH